MEHLVPDTELLESVRKYGVLHPPAIQLLNNKYIVVSGKKRILAAKSIASKEKLLCLVVPQESPELSVYTILLEESFAGKPMSLIQQADFFNRLLQFCHIEDALPLLSRFGHKPVKYVLEDLLSLLSLGKNSLLAVHRGEILHKTARKMTKMNEADQNVITQLIQALRLGSSKQLKLVEYSTELIMRTGLPLKSLLDEFIAVDDPDNPNIPQRAAALLGWLQKECSPRTAEAEIKFKEFTAQLRLPAHMQLKHTPSFEDDKLTLIMVFDNMKSLQHLLPEIKRITRKE